MSILLNKEETELIATCECGCQNAVHLKIDQEDQEMYCLMMWMNGNWYRDQEHKILRVIGRKLRKIWCIIRNKDFHHQEIIMNKEDFLRFREYVNGVDCI